MRHTILEKIQRYRSCADEDETHLYHFYLGMRNVQKNGYSAEFVKKLEVETESKSVQSYLKGYLEGS